jgi:formylglycine-generating enzyme required for sulfatase activity
MPRSISLGFVLMVFVMGMGLMAVGEDISAPKLWWKPAKEQNEYARKAKLPLVHENSLGMKLVLIPPGTFTMGSPPGEKGHDRYEIQHRVTLTRGFYMGSTEVTQGQYRTATGKNPSHFKGDDRPVEMVSWHDAVGFCKKLTEQERAAKKIGSGDSYRLPTEAEWEYACRAGTTTPFFFGRTISTDQANYDGDYVYKNGRKGVNRGQTIKAGSFPPNAYGLYDMHGNVWEWCWDRYRKYPEEPVVDPTGPRVGSFRVSRGGSWLYGPIFCRSALRFRYDPSYRFDSLGFRVVLVRSALKER